MKHYDIKAGQPLTKPPVPPKSPPAGGRREPEGCRCADVLARGLVAHAALTGAFLALAFGGKR